ncbi:MAG TPA: hypothetical protein VK879_09825 [Candidatus Sulfomarinibacteraceae bacterium]|nr:hypothetical protein [Candidatus Sulfomarinibacteraceae bacterium]
MELRAYWRILMRRWPLVLVPALVILAVGLATYSTPPTVYNVGVRFVVSQPPSPAAGDSDEERYYNWLTSEYIVNALTDWVQGNQFGEAVRRELAQRGVDVPPGSVQAGLVADNARSMFTLSLVHGDPDILAQMMDAAVTVLQEQNTAALPQLGQTPATLVPLDEPVVNALPPGIRAQLELPLRLAVGVAAGVALAFLVDYLDPTVRNRDEVEALGLPILGEIPDK